MVELTCGIVLAGGLSRRMGGRDKTLLRVAGQTILERIVHRLAPQCVGLMLSANGDPRRFARFGLPIVADTVPGSAGPLAGLLAALDGLAERRPEIPWVVSAPSDTPFLPGDLVARLHADRATTGARLAYASSGGRRHGVVGLWPVSLRHDLRAFLVEAGLRKVKDFVDRYAVADVAWPTEPFDPFFNANAPEDLARAELIARIADGAKR